MQPACDTLTTCAAAHFRRPMPRQFGDTSRPARRANEATGAGAALGLRAGDCGREITIEIFYFRLIGPEAFLKKSLAS